jgi:hypothetical protein
MLYILATILSLLDLILTLVCIKKYGRYIEESNIIWVFVMDKYGLLIFSFLYIIIFILILFFINYFFINYLEEALIGIISTFTIILLNNIYILIKIRSKIKKNI